MMLLRGIIDNYNPATGRVYSLIPDSDERDVEKAVQAAKTAFPAWSAMSSEKRLGYLMAIANKIEENLEGLAIAESKDNGKPLWLAKAVDIPRASSTKFMQRLVCTIIPIALIWMEWL